MAKHDAESVEGVLRPLWKYFPTLRRRPRARRCPAHVDPTRRLPSLRQRHRAQLREGLGTQCNFEPQLPRRIPTGHRLRLAARQLHRFALGGERRRRSPRGDESSRRIIVEEQHVSPRRRRVRFRRRPLRFRFLQSDHRPRPARHARSPVESRARPHLARRAHEQTARKGLAKNRGRAGRRFNRVAHPPAKYRPPPRAHCPPQTRRGRRAGSRCMGRRAATPATQFRSSPPRSFVGARHHRCRPPAVDFNPHPLRRSTHARGRGAARPSDRRTRARRGGAPHASRRRSSSACAHGCDQRRRPPPSVAPRIRRRRRASAPHRARRAADAHRSPRRHQAPQGAFGSRAGSFSGYARRSLADPQHHVRQRTSARHQERRETKRESARHHRRHVSNIH